MEIEYYCGAVFGWCFCSRTYEWLYCLLYWPARKIRELLPQRYKTRRLRFFSGLMPRARGLHYDCQISSGRWY